MGVILLTLGMSVTDVHAQQPLTQPVRGRVNPAPSRTPGAPVPGLPGAAPVARGNQVRLNGKTAAGGSIIWTAAIAPDGAFEFLDVPRGEYQVAVLPSTLAPQPLVVGDTAPPELQFGDPPARVAVTVNVESGGPQPRFSLEFTDASAVVRAADAYPTFVAELPPGSFTITASGLPARFSLRSASPVSLRSGETTRVALTLDVAAPPPFVRLSGRITGSVGPTPVRGIRLTGPASATVLTATVNADGSFEFPRVLPGAYAALLFPAPIHFARPVTVGNTDTSSVVFAAPGIAELVGEFVRIAPGEFMMGCSPGDVACESGELPTHRVAISRAFEIGKFEVTQAQWEAVMGFNPSQFKGRDRPVDNINTWTDAQEFIDRLNQLGDGYRYRLPTEAEWEYAARAGSTEPHPGAAAGLETLAWYQATAGGESHPVGQKQPNAWGLYDTLGNVAEWVDDWHDPAYYAVSPERDPKGPQDGSTRVVRGGAWGMIPNWLRVSSRRILPFNSYGSFGLRLARERVSP